MERATCHENPTLEDVGSTESARLHISTLVLSSRRSRGWLVAVNVEEIKRNPLTNCRKDDFNGRIQPFAQEL